jgi:hypothetical protein
LKEIIHACACVLLFGFFRERRRQNFTPEELIGTQANVHLEFPDAPEIKAKKRRGRNQLGYYHIEEGGHFGKKTKQWRRS